MTPCECGFCKYMLALLEKVPDESKMVGEDLIQTIPEHAPMSMHDMAELAIRMVESMVWRIRSQDPPTDDELAAVDLFLTLCDDMAKNG